MGEEFVNRSVIGTRFGARIVGTTEVGGLPAVVPEISGRAWITGMGQYMLDPGGSVPGRVRPLSSAEVAIVGAGIVGCATAYELARRGVRVRLIDRGEVSGGTTGLGEGNVLCCDKRPGPELVLAQLGLALYDELEELLGAEAGIRRKGALVVHAGAESWEAEPERIAGLRAAGVECELLEPDEVRAAEPELSGELAGRLVLPARPPVRAARDRPRAGARGRAARRTGRDRPRGGVDRGRRRAR